MTSWILTVPKTTPWPTYQKELATVADGTSVLNYRTRYIPKDMREGDRCYVVHAGRVRGWMVITGLVDHAQAWRCSTTGDTWPPGKYIQRSGSFHEVEGPNFKGFRGVRRYEPPEVKVATRWVTAS